MNLRNCRKDWDRISMHLCECYNDNTHLWIQSRGSVIQWGNFRTKCPHCQSSVKLITSKITGNPNYITRKVSFTLVEARLAWDNVAMEDFIKTSALLTLLKSRNFAARDINSAPWSFIFENDKNEFVVFIWANKRKTSTMYIGLQEEDSEFLAEIAKANAQDKKNSMNARREKSKEEKPSITTMQDVLGYQIKVGDYVMQWSSSSLTFGKIEVIAKHPLAKENPYYKDRIIAKVRGKNGILGPMKESDQIFLLPEDKAMLMLLEK